MNQKDEFSKWISTIENALSNKPSTNLEESIPVSECNCGNWDCKCCFPDTYRQDYADDSEELSFGHNQDLEVYPASDVVVDFKENGSCGGMGAGGMAQVEEEDFFGDSDGQQSPLTYGHDIESDNESEHLPIAPVAISQIRLHNTIPSDIMRDYMSRIIQDSGCAEPEFPDADAIPQLDQEQIQTRLGRYTNIPRSAKSAKVEIQTPTLFEQIKWDEEINEIFKKIKMSESTFDSEELDEVRTIGHVGDIAGHGKIVQCAKCDTDLRDDHGYALDNGTYVCRNGDKCAMRQSRKHLDAMAAKGQKPRWRKDESAELDESTLSKTIGSHKGGQRLVKWMHSKHKLSNEAELVPVPFGPKPFWSQFKRNPDDFVIVVGSNGAAGIKPSEEYFRHMQAKHARAGTVYKPQNDNTQRYQIVAFTDEGEKVDSAELQSSKGRGDFETDDPTTINARMGVPFGRDNQSSNNVFELLSQKIGRIQTVYISGWENADPDLDAPQPKGSIEREKMAKRADLAKVEKIPEKDAILRIFNKVKPVLKTLADQALSQVQRTMQNGNHENSQKLSRSADKLKQFIANLDTSDEINIDNAPDSPTREFSNVIINSIESASGSHRGSSDFQKWLNDAAKGNSAALKPVLDALRRKLASLS